jgi:predicted nuclease with TOPRIM domain
MLSCCAAKRSNDNVLKGRGGVIGGEGTKKLLGELESAKEALAKENEKLKAELSRLKQNEAELKRLQEEMKHLHEHGSDSMKKEMDELRKKLQQSQKKLSRIGDEARKKGEHERELQERLEKLKHELSEVKTKDADAISDLKNSLDHKDSELKSELEKENELRMTMMKYQNQSKSNRRIFQEYLNVNHDGADILVCLHEFCDVIVKTRGDKRESEMWALLEKEVRSEGTEMRKVCKKLYDIAKKKNKVLESKQFNLVLEVLFKRYNYMVGRRLIDAISKEIEDRQVAASNGDDKKQEEIDMWESILETIDYNVLPNQNAQDIAQSNIENSKAKYQNNEEKSLSFEVFVEFVCDYMTGSEDQSPLMGTYWMEDLWKEEQNRAIDDDA